MPKYFQVFKKREENSRRIIQNTRSLSSNFLWLVRMNKSRDNFLSIKNFKGKHYFYRYIFWKYFIRNILCENMRVDTADIRVDYLIWSNKKCTKIPQHIFVRKKYKKCHNLLTKVLNSAQVSIGNVENISKIYQIARSTVTCFIDSTKATYEPLPKPTSTIFTQMVGCGYRSKQCNEHRYAKIH